MSRGKLGELLIAEGLLTPDQLTSAQEHKTKFRTPLTSSLVQLGHVNENVLATFLSKQYGIPAVSLEEIETPTELFKLVPLSICEKHGVLPLSLENGKVNIAISDPTNVTAIDDIRFVTNMDVEVFIATPSAIKMVLERAYASQGSEQLNREVKNLNRSVSSEVTGAIEVASLEREAIAVEEEGAGEKPVIRLINRLFVESIRKKASDIHIEPFENYSRVRIRVDGSLFEIMRLPPQLRAAVPQRIKVMATMDIGEKRLPQDGRIQLKTKDRQIDVRVSTLPTVFGEKVVLRLLDQGNSTPNLEKSGFEEEQIKLFREAARQPYGMVLVTGPTGSGKSTTLYGILSELNNSDSNISTVEDPVEYNMAGVNQVQMKDSIGLNFASALRSLLRQDPDIIMVGEIRDQETAEIAVKAALTGHMVFSTLHTNDAPSTISRLLHMGLEPFLITAALTLVQAQRLVRVICENCKDVDEKVTPEMLLAAEVPKEWLDQFKPMRGKGCDRCAGTGYRGRLGIFEVMLLTEDLRSRIIKGANADQLKRFAVDDGMLTLRQSALMKLFRGTTTLEEVLNNSRPDNDLLKG